ncbi:hypothetical protein EON77_13105 [bacterium]|nr:MAG: hypothetical protein EON77_13105 [bacterium]
MKGDAATAKRMVEIERGLLESKGKTDLRVTLAGVNPARIEALRKAGFVVESHDGKTLVFGSATAAQIRAIAKFEWVIRIVRLHPTLAKG